MIEFRKNFKRRKLMKKILNIISFLVISMTALSLAIDGNMVVDNIGNKIEMKEYKKIIVIDPAAVEIIYLLGREENIEAIADTSTTKIWPAEKTSKLPSIGNITKPSIEKIVYHQPDLVILNPMIAGFSDVLTERKIPYLVNSASNFDEILNSVRVYGALTGDKEKGETVAREYKNKLTDLKEDIQKNPLNLKGAFLFSTSPMMAFNSKSLPGEIFRLLGIENIADNLPGGRPIISPEFIVATNPDVLLGAMNISRKEDILNSNPIVKETTAGKTGNIAIVESDRILRPTPRIIEAVEELYRELSRES